LIVTKYAFFPGCSLLSSAAEYATSTKEVCERFGIKLEEIDDWVCCGATPAHVKSHLLSIALPAISCAAAEKSGLDVLACCAACFNRLKIANHEMCEDETLRQEVNEIIEEEYGGTTKVYHLLEVLAARMNGSGRSPTMNRPLDGLKVAPYYGCLIARMPEPLRIDSVENPTMLDDVLKKAGADVVDWAYKTECCGASLTLASTKTVIRLSGNILQAAKHAGADCVAVVCPLCQANLDMYQGEAATRLGEPLNMPVLYFTQLLGLAIGVKPEKLGLKRLIVDTTPVLEKIGIETVKACL
jgi:heterodisulfide reductase subunit B